MFTQFQNYAQKNIGTLSTAVVTCPAGQQLLVNQISCANTTDFPVTCSVTVTRSGTTAFIVNNATIPARGSLTCAGKEQKVVLMAGDQLRVQSNTAASLDVVVSGVLNDYNSLATVPAPVAGIQATFSIVPSQTVIYKNLALGANSVTYTITTTNVPNGTVLYWENIGTTDRSDFTDDRNEGQVTITSGTGQITRTLVNSNTLGNETIIIALRFGLPPLGGVVAVAATVTASDSVSTSGLVMYLDAGISASYPGSGTTWSDISGNGNTATMLNGLSYSSNDQGVMVFDGVDDYANIPYNSSLAPTTAITMEAFCYVENSGKALTTVMCYPFDTTHISPYFEWTIFLHEANKELLTRINGVTSRVTTNWAYNTWYHFAITWTGSTVKFYQNGVQIGGDFANAQNTIVYERNLPVLIGRNASGTEQFKGRIGSLRLYNRVLSASELATNFNLSKARFGL